eukprot:6081855-Pyramimonas_sp.AAC.1
MPGRFVPAQVSWIPPARPLQSALGHPRCISSPGVQPLGPPRDRDVVGAAIRFSCLGAVPLPLRALQLLLHME